MNRIVYIVCALMAALFVSSCGRPETQFSTNDASLITSIVLVQDTLQVTLTKTDSCWLVDGAYTASEEAVDMLLYILTTQQVKAPIPDEKASSLASELNANGLHIKAYQGRKAKLSFKVHANSMGYYGVVDGKKQLYALELPGSEENPYTYLSAMPSFWRPNVIVSALPSEMLMVQIDNLEDPEKSYRISRKRDGSLELYDLYNQQAIEGVSDTVLNVYLGYFNGLAYERILDLKPEDHQIILLSPSPYLMTIKTANNDHIVLQLFYIAGEKLDPYGNPLDYNPDRFYLSMNDGRDIAMARWVDFDLLLRDLSDFVEN